jgi:hypothetical protein
VNYQTVSSPLISDLLLQDIYKVQETSDIDLEMWLAVAKRMSELNKVLTPIIEQDKKRTEKKKQFILANSFTSFMYIMLAIGINASERDISKVNFSTLIPLFKLLIKHGLVTDHSSFDQMLSTIKKLNIEKSENDLIFTLFTHTGKTVKEEFEDGIPSPRFVISSVIFKNGATFIFSNLLDENNSESLKEFREDSQKTFGFGGLVLMDKQKENIIKYLDNAQSSPQNELIIPLLIKGEGFAGHGYLHGLKLPSPSAKMETIYLLPGREGTPAFVRARSLMLDVFVAL